MKKLLSILTLCMGLCCVSCYDDSALVERIDALEQSTIASLKASISSLESQSGDIKSSIASLEQSGNANATEIAALKTSLGAIEAKIEELKSWVEKLLEGYYTKEEIDAQIQSLNTEIETLRTKISSIESKLDILMREFVISFDDTEIGILAGGTTSVGYTITGATEKTTVKALGQNGWSAKVTPDGTDKGKITVTAPDPLTEDEIIVLVYDGEFRTIMNTINFVTGVVTPSQTAVELEAEAGTVEITVTSNLNYQISIPEDAKDWLSVVETKSMSTNTITFAYSENTGVIRSTSVSFKTSETIAKINFIQSGSALEVTVSEVGTLKNQISDSMSANLKGLIIHGILDNTDYAYIKNTLINLEVLDISDISNTTIPAELFKDNKKITRVNLPKALTEIPAGLFRSSSIKEVQIPNTVEKVRMYAFYSCYKLSEISLNEGLTEIEDYAYQGCYYKGVLTMPNTLTRIGSCAFSDNRFTKIIFSENLEYLSGSVFYRCGLQGDLVLPDKLRSIDIGCFSSNNFSGKLILGKSTSWIGYHAFSGASTFDVVYSKNPTPPDFDYLGEEGLNKQHLVVPIGSLTAYKEHRIWGQFLIIEEADI